MARLLPLALLLAALPVAAQSGPAAAVTGTVADTTGLALPGATVVLLSPADSALVGYAAAGADGAFRVARVAPGAYVLRASFVGYAARTVPIAVERDGLDVGTLALAPEDGPLGQLVVEADRVPVVMRADTLVYDPAAFRVGPGADVEDLLRELPGIDVAEDGSIRANGEEVRRVLVDGKEFFGDDPTVATRNLPADAVDRVEVFDRASDTAAFTGVDDGEGERTLNLALKDGHRAGGFGHLTSGLGGGGGAPLLYDERGAAHRFSPSTRVSLIGTLNNVNRQTFSITDYLQFMGGASALGDGGLIRISGDDLPVGDGLSDGFVTTASGGLHLDHETAAGTEVRASYLAYRVAADRDQTAAGAALAGGATTLIEEATSTDGRSWAHRVHLGAEHALGEGHDLTFESTLRLNGAATDAATARRTFDADGALTADDRTLGVGRGRAAGAEGTATYRRRLGGGRSVIVEARGGASGTDDADAFTDAQTSRDQSRRGDARDGSARVLFTHPLGEGVALQASAEAGAVRDGETVAEAGASASTFARRLDTAEARATVRREGPLALSAGLAVRHARSAAGGLPTTARTHLLPSLSATLRSRAQHRLELRYAASTREPSVRELHPVADARDPFLTTIGTPDLRPEVSHALSVRALRFDLFASTSLVAFGRAAYTADAISTTRTVGAGLRQTVRPINLGGAWSFLGNASYAMPVRAVRSRLDLTGTAYHDRRSALVDGAETRAALTRVTAGARLQSRASAPAGLAVGAELALQQSAYSLAPELGRTYLEPAVEAEARWSVAGWELRTDLDLRFYRGPGLDARRVPLWGAEVSRAVFGDRARLQLAATDLLDQNVGVRYTQTATYAEERRVRSLGRHVVLSLRYDLAPVR